METQMKTPGSAAVEPLYGRVPRAENLNRTPRPFETLIQGLLFFSGAVSIFTTVSIVIVLTTESLRFFTDLGWRDTNNEIVEALDETVTTFTISEGGYDFQAGELILVDEEEMRVVAFDQTTRKMEVERGVDGTAVFSHPAGKFVRVGERPTLGEFLTNTKWIPQASEFGILPLLGATLMTSLIAMLVAIPIGLGAAIYISEYASLRVRNTLKPLLELLAGVPTVVYGYFALTFMTPLLRALLGQDTVEIYNQASAGLVMGIMIIPTISSMSEDALSSVPRSLREASYGLGATRLETTFRVLLPAALSGIIAAFILGISRAVGETMIVAIASGAGPAWTLWPFRPFVGAETMTGHIARISTGDISFGSIDYNSLFAIGLTLFLITLVLNILSNSIIRRYRQVYA
jgi:phosphate transport system permease protein